MSDIVERTYRIKVRGDESSLDDIEARFREILEESEDESGTKGTLKMTNEIPIEYEPEEDDEDDADYDDEDVEDDD